MAQRSEYRGPVARRLDIRKNVLVPVLQELIKQTSAETRKGHDGAGGLSSGEDRAEEGARWLSPSGPASWPLTPHSTAWMCLLLWLHGSRHTLATTNARVPGPQRVVSRPHSGERNTSCTLAFGLAFGEQRAGTKVSWGRCSGSAAARPSQVQGLLTLWGHGVL